MSEDTTQRDLGRLEGKIDLILSSLPAFNDRLSAVERWKWRVTGALSAIGGAVAVIVWFIGTLISLRH
jgi:hypothetical protein